MICYDMSALLRKIGMDLGLVAGAFDVPETFL